MKTYDPEVVGFIVAGDHVPVTPVGEVVLKSGGVAPEQNGGILANPGVWFDPTVNVSVVGVDTVHCPA